MDYVGGLDLVIAVPTFIASVLSFVATNVAIALHIVKPPKRHFRHSLIINLLVADFINALNNTVSGAITLASGFRSEDDHADAGCIVNAWIGQFSVQAVDFNILIISIIVLHTIVSSRPVAESSTRATVAICVAAWIPGLITGTVGLALDSYGHVSGNWCWIKPEFLGLRYGLTHGWRIAIFAITIGIYTYIYIHLKRVFGRFRVSNPSTGNTTTNNDQTLLDHGTDASDTQHILVHSSFAVSHELDERPSVSPPHGPNDIALDALPSAKATFCSVSVEDAGPAATAASATYAPPSAARVGPGKLDKERAGSKMPAPPNIKKMLLMNGYPLAYILLWLPGIINRLTESLGSSPRWLRALQFSTQLIGFVNAFNYGFSEHLRRAVRRWKKKKGFARAR